MGFEMVTGGNELLLGVLKEGEHVECYVTGAVMQKNKFGNDQWHFKVKTIDGRDSILKTAGNAKYKAQNLASAIGLIPSEEKFKAAEDQMKAVLGYLCRFTMENKYKNKTGQEVRNYSIAMDKNKPVSGAPVIGTVPDSITL